MAIGLNLRSLPTDSEARAAAQWAIDQGIAVEDNSAPVDDAVITDILERFREDSSFNGASVPANGGATRLQAGISPPASGVGLVDVNPDLAELEAIRPLAENPTEPFGAGLQDVARKVVDTLDSD